MFANSDLEKARNTNLFELLSQRGYTLIKEGSQYRIADHEGLIVHENKWFRHSLNIGGNPIDLIMHLENLSFRKAVEQILGNQIKNNDDYLIKQRLIDAELVNELISLDFIKYENDKVFFFGYENQGDLKNWGKIVCTTWRSTVSDAKGELKNSKKQYSFSIPDFVGCQSGQRQIIIAESPIDILSIACLEQRKYKKGYYQTYKIALCGLTQPHLGKRIQSLRPTNIFLALDNDAPGKNAAIKLQSQLQKIAPTHIVQYQGKDPNEYLIQLLKSNQS